MQFIAAAIIGGLASAMGSLVGRLLLALGIGFVSYTGFDVLLGQLLEAMQTNIGSIPGTLWSWMALLKVQTSISIMSSALTTRLAMATVGGAVKRMIPR